MVLENPETFDEFWQELKHSLAVQIRLFHSQIFTTNIPTVSIFCNQRPSPSWPFSGPNNDLTWGANFHLDKATARSSCHTKRLLQPFNWQLLITLPPCSWCCWDGNWQTVFRNEEEVNMAVQEWLLMPGLDFYPEGNFVTLQEMGQSHQCVWQLCWKLMKLQWNKRDTYS